MDDEGARARGRLAWWDQMARWQAVIELLDELDEHVTDLADEVVTMRGRLSLVRDVVAKLMDDEEGRWER